MGEVCVYELTDPATGRVFYVGMGQEKRGRAHVNETQRWLSGRGVFGTNLHKLRVIARILSEGKRPEFKIVLRTSDRREACDMERALIARYGPALTNQLPGGEGGRFPGFVVSDETRAKIRATLRGRKLSPEHVAKMKGRVPHNKGVPASDDLRRKFSEAQKESEACRIRLARMHEGNKGRKRSEETKGRMAEAQRLRYANGYSREFTEAERRHISEVQKGRKQSTETIEKRAASIRAGYADGSHVPYWRGRAGPNTGRKFSAETRRRMSESRKGRKLTDAHRENLTRGVRAYWAARREGQRG